MASKWPYNTLHWRQVRARVLLRDGRCRAAWPHRCTCIATEVHHIKPPSDGGHPFDPVNLMAVCKSANVAERNVRRARWARIHAGEETSEPVDVEVIRAW